MEGDPLSTYTYDYSYINYENGQMQLSDKINLEPKTSNNSNESINESHNQNNGCSLSNNSVDNELKNNKDTPNNNNNNSNSAPSVSKTSLNKRVKTKVKKERSNYWSEKITQEGFPFYACAICNINFPLLSELDQHVTTHKGRPTSYDLRVKSKKRRKVREKERKRYLKMCKKGGIKKENDLEIKPEEGYIGNVKANDYNSKESEEIFDNNIKNEKKEVKQSSEEVNLEKIFKCHACQKQFALSYYLKLHVRSHTDEKPYTCNICGLSFITASKLGRHNKRIHLAIRHQCRICFKKFCRFDNLKRHFDKSHSEQILEGEPYDYNVILPYLKELEDELINKEVNKSTEDEKNNYEDTASTGVLEKDEKNQNTKDFPQDEVQETVKVEVKDEDLNGFGLKEEETVGQDPTDPVMTDPDGNDTDSVRDENDDCSVKDEKRKRKKSKHSVKNKSTPIKQKRPYRKRPFSCEHCQKKFLHKDTLEVHQMSHQVQETVKVEVKDEDLNGFALKEEETDGQDPTKDETSHPNETDSVRDENDDCSVKDENSSDSDYFPAFTWAVAPSPPSTPCDPPAEGESPPASARLSCGTCGKRISSPSYMRVHMRTHTGERPFECGVCGRAFITSSKMNRHMLTHRSDADIKDDSEKMEVKSENEEVNETEKRKRKKSKHSVNKSKSAPIKQKRPYRKRPFSCVHCQKKFLHKDTLEVHQMSHQGEEKTLKCQYCLEVYQSEDILKAHEAEHEGPKPYMCTLCGKTYKRRETMIYHRKNHKASRTHQCDVCTKSFSAACKLARHALSHRTVRFSQQFECPVCAHMFHTKYHVQMHLSTHLKEGIIIEENLNEILAMVLQNARRIPKDDKSPLPTLPAPQDEMSRVCNICGEVFQHFYYLEEHLKGHGTKFAVENFDKEEEKKYICEVCNKGFKLHYYLKLHSYTHTKQKPFICQQCGKGFITKGKLKRHFETHSGLKKYQCHICLKFFTRPSYLRIHIRTIHGANTTIMLGFQRI